MNSYLVNEIYPCLQGEGSNTGKPALLIRFQICNLKCVWCDTPYTQSYYSDPVTLNNKEQKFKRYKIDELISIINSYPQKHLILSGGEPTLQNIGFLMRKLGKAYTAEAESNGTRVPHKQVANFLESDYNLIQWNISPKFSNAEAKLETNALKHWVLLSQKQLAVFFKFVIRKQYQDQDLSEILKIINDYNISSKHVFLMPEGITLESQVGNIWLHDICLKYGFNYTSRLHIILFGNQRGT